MDRPCAGPGTRSGIARVEEISEQLTIDDHGPAVTNALTLGELLGQLKPAQSEVIRLVKRDGLSIAEAARRTG